MRRQKAEGQMELKDHSGSFQMVPEEVVKTQPGQGQNYIPGEALSFGHG